MSRSDRRPRLGSTEWERAGGPPLSLGERLELLASAAVVLSSHFSQKWGFRRGAPVPRLDPSCWAPPDSALAHQAEALVQEACSPPVAHHCFRSYCFAVALHALDPERPPLDREALYVGAVLHDLGLEKDLAKPGEHCFTVGTAREARSLAARAGWDMARQDLLARVITSNLNPVIRLEEWGSEAYFMSVGGQVEVLAQEWKLNPENVAEILARHPRVGYREAMLPHIEAEERRHPRCRFACLEPVFTTLVRRSRFSAE
jgi:hypothetical protein